MTDKSNYTWIKFHIDLLDDAFFMNLSGDAVSVFTKLYLLAGRMDAGGAFVDKNGLLDIGSISWHLRASDDFTKNCLEELIDAGLVNELDNGYEIANFMDEQGPGDNIKRGEWRERQRKHREKLRIKNEEEEQEVEERREESHGAVTVTSELSHTPLSSDTAFIYFPNTNQPDYDNGLTRDDPFYRIAIGVIEFGMTYQIGHGYLLRKDETIPYGYYKITKNGVESIKHYFNHDSSDVDMEKLCEVVDYWYWYCLTNGSDICDLTKILDLYSTGVKTEIVKHPEIYKKSLEVEVIKEVTGLEPNIKLLPRIYETFDVINPRHNIEILSDLYQTWIGRGYKANNYDWFFDWYANGVEV